MKVPRNKSIEKDHKTTLKELPYYNFTGSLALHLGHLNNSVTCSSQSRRNLDKISSLHNLDLFELNSDFNTNLNVNHHLPNQQIYSRYFTPHSFKKSFDKFSYNEVQTSFSLFHNNIVNLNRNFEELLTILDDLDLHFDVVGVSETKITASNDNSKHPSIPGYVSEYVPTPLASGGVGLFSDEFLDYKVIEKSFNEAFQALWIEISLYANKNIIIMWNHLPSTQLP